MAAPLTRTDRLDDATAYRLQRVARRLRYSLARALESWDTGLSPEQFALLFRLHERDGRAQHELADPVLDDRPNITRRVAGLEARGLLRRGADPTDGRVRLVYLTPSGRSFLDDLLPKVVAERQRLFAGLSAAQLDTFEQVLDLLESRALGPED